MHTKYTPSLPSLKFGLKRHAFSWVKSKQVFSVWVRVQKYAGAALTLISVLVPHSNGDELYGHDPEFVEAINKAQDLWTATHYPQFERRTLDEMVRMAGGPKSRIDR